MILYTLGATWLLWAAVQNCAPILKVRPGAIDADTPVWSQLIVLCIVQPLALPVVAFCMLVWLIVTAGGWFMEAIASAHEMIRRRLESRAERRGLAVKISQSLAEDERVLERVRLERQFPPVSPDDLWAVEHGSGFLCFETQEAAEAYARSTPLTIDGDALCVRFPKIRAPRHIDPSRRLWNVGVTFEQQPVRPVVSAWAGQAWAGWRDGRLAVRQAERWLASRS